MKKILIIPSWYPTKESKLIGSFFEEQAKFLFARGFDVRVLYVRQAKKKCNKFFFKNSSNDTFSIEKTENAPATFFGEQTIYNCLSFEQEIEKLGDAYAKGWESVISDGWKPDMIHAQSSLNAGIVASKLSKLYAIPYCITEHVPLFFSNRTSVQDELLIESLENASKVGVVSYHLLRHILMQYINISPKVIWNFVDEKRFRIKDKAPNEGFKIVTVAHPLFIKDLDTFFKAVQHLFNSSKINCEVVVVGNEDYSESASANTRRTETMAKKYNVRDKCTFIPFIARSEMPDFLRTADVFICTSIAETFGIAIREALMCGVPVISTKNGGAEDVINKKNGFLVNLQDSEDIAHRIMQLIKKEISFDPKIIRETAIEQSGSDTFLKTMSDFYAF